MKTGRVNKVYLSGLAVLAVLAVVHYLDVQTGVRETGAVWLRSRYWLVAVFGIAVSAVCGAMLYRSCRIERVFLAAIFGFGMLYLFVLPPLSAPDEIRHYISAYHLSSKLLGEEASDKWGNVYVRLEDWYAEDSGGAYEVSRREDGTWAVSENGAEEAVVLGQYLDDRTYESIHAYASGQEQPYRNYRNEPGTEANLEMNPELNSEARAVSIHQAVATTPFAYLVPALGISLARLLKLNTLWLLYLGRFFNLSLFAALVYCALRRLPAGKEIMLGAALLPMTLHLAASFSYDVELISGIFLFTAICMDLAYQKDKVSWLDIAILTAIMAMIGPCKMVYAVFMGLCLLIPVKKFGSWKRWTVSAACVLGAWVIAMILINRQTVAIYVADTTETYIAWAEEPGYSLGTLIHQPIRAFRIFYQTLLIETELWHKTMIGAYLGNLDAVLNVPYLVVLGLTGGLILLAMKKQGEDDRDDIKLGQKLWIWLLCAACTGALMLSMLIAWTPGGSQTVCGVQGRYFLPFLPVFLMTLKNNTLVLTKNCDRTILYLMCCTNAYVLFRVFSIVCMRL